MQSRLLAATIGLALAACTPDGLATPELPACGTWAGGHWDSRFVTAGAHGGFSTSVASIVKLPDGRIAVAGDFEGMSGVSARNVAAWNGTTWAAFGEGLPGHVSELAVDDEGTLWAVGQDSDILFSGPSPDEIGGGYVARWTGSAWTYVAHHFDMFNGIVAIDGGVAVYGTFTAIDRTFARGLAVYRDGQWQGITENSAFVSAALRDGAGLCAAGQIEGFTGVSCWDGTATWTPKGTPLDVVHALARLPDGRLLAGGENNVGGILELVEETSSWRTFEGGVAPLIGEGVLDRVLAMALDGDAVVIAGAFATVGGDAGTPTTSHDIARWEPDKGWIAMTGANDEILGGFVQAVAVDGGRTYLGGNFRQVGNIASAAVAVVEADHTKHALPDTGTSVLVGRGDDLIVTDTGIVAAGQFTDTKLMRFDGTLTALPSPPVGGPDAWFEVVSLANGELAMLVYRPGDSIQTLVWSRDGQWYEIVDETVTGPIASDGNGGLFFIVPSFRQGPPIEPDLLPTQIPVATIIHATFDDVGVFARIDGIVSRMLVHDGNLVVSVALGGGGEAALRYRDEAWETIGAWPQPLAGLVSSPALGLVAGTSEGARVWNGSIWVPVSDQPAYALAACSDGVAAAVSDDEGSSRLSFLGSIEDGWQALSEPSEVSVRQIAPAAGGIYVLRGESSTSSAAGLSRWTTLDDTGW